MKRKILILANSDIGLYRFRKELIQKLLARYNVYISLPFGEFIPELLGLGCIYVKTPISRRGTNPVTDFILLIKYLWILMWVKPEVVLTYTIKPNIYGGIACRILRVPYISNITGLGTSIENGGMLKKAALMLYAIGIKKAACIFFQNESNQNLFTSMKIAGNRARCIPGSGVNLEQHCFEEYPDTSKVIKFLFVGRIMKDKGVCELFAAASQIKTRYTDVQFDLIGTIEEDFSKFIEQLENKGIIKFHGFQHDVHSFIKESHAIILPSYHEGKSNVLLEAASSGRPIIASDVAGCRETFDDGVSGFGCEVKNADSLADRIVKFIELPYEKKKAMGLAGRRKMEREFDRNLVINAYTDEIYKILGDLGEAQYETI